MCLTNNNITGVLKTSGDKAMELTYFKMSVQVARKNKAMTSSNMHVSLGLALNCVCETGN